MANEPKTIQIKESFTELKEVKDAFTPEQVKFVMSTIAPTLNEQQIWLFLLKANKLGLNPLLGEIFAYSNSDGKLVIIEGRNGKRNLAAKTGKVEYIKTEAIYTKEITVPATSDNGMQEQKTTIKVDPWDGMLWGARSEVKVKGIKQPFVETAKLSEYDTKKNVWLSKPETMIKKVAESQALSAALPQMADLLGEAENYLAGGEGKTLPQIAGGNEPATKSQLETLKKMGADMKKSYTGQEAIVEIDRLLTEKRTAKKAEKTEEKAEVATPAPATEEAAK